MEEDCKWVVEKQEGPDGETGPLDYENTLCRDRLWLYCQADLEFLSSGDPPASGPITRIRGRERSDKCVSKVE